MAGIPLLYDVSCLDVERLQCLQKQAYSHILIHISKYFILAIKLSCLHSLEQNGFGALWIVSTAVQWVFYH